MSDRDGFPKVPEVENNWRWLLALGVGLIVLGGIGLSSFAVRELIAALVLGPLLIASGILQILLAFFARRRREAPLHLAAAALDWVVGFLVLTHPRKTIDDLILVLTAFLLVGGLSRILGSAFLRFRTWGWSLAAGVVAVVLGAIVWKEGAFRGLWLVGVCVAIDFICHGVSWVVLSQSIRAQLPTTTRTDPATAEATRDGRTALDRPVRTPR